MITIEEREEIINAAVERILGKLPEILEKTKEEILLVTPQVMSNLMVKNATFAKTSSDFYAAHPELKDKKQIVATVIEEVSGKHPEMSDLNKLYEIALPLIRERIRVLDKLDTKTVKEPNRDFTGEV